MANLRTLRRVISKETTRTHLYHGPHIALSLVRVNGYATECERTFFLAPPSNDVKDAFAAMIAARQRAFALMCPGACWADIDAAANGYLRDQR